MTPEIASRIQALREELHRFPEVSQQEYETTQRLRSAMGPLGLTELPLPTPTGCAFRLHTGKGNGAILLRGDIDALAATENRLHTLRSRNEGRMHACGHDFHMAGLYGAALLLLERKEELPMDVIFLFQPGEENITGAIAITQSGFLESQDVRAVFGLHNLPDLDHGTIALAPGPVMAAEDGLHITIRGKSGHGAMPENCADPIVAAAAVIQGLQTVVSRNLAPMDSGVVTIASIHCGNTDNRIEDRLTMTGCIRSLNPESRDTIMARVQEIVECTARAQGCRGEAVFADGVPAVVNAAELWDTVLDAARAVFGEDHIAGTRGMMISEDFSHYSRHAPSFFAFLGSGFPGRENEGLHSGSYLAHPDTAITAASFLAQCVLQYKG